jgi:predicted transcriptional regulator
LTAENSWCTIVVAFTTTNFEVTMKDAVQILQKLGFGDYEARAYAGLLQRSPLTGYELAKITGVPRANIYDIFPRLEERGAIVRLDSPSGARYSAVPPSELLPRLAGRFNDDLAAAEKTLTTPESATNQDYAWNVQSYRAVLDHARSLVDVAVNDMVIATWPQEAAALASNLSDARERGVSITTLCLNACAQECGGCQGSIYRYRLSPEDAGRWLVVAADGKELLAGEIDTQDSAHAIRTTHPLIVELGTWYVRNGVALATLVSDIGDRLPGLLSAGAASVLSSLGPSGIPGGWLQHMGEILRRSGVR